MIPENEKELLEASAKELFDHAPCGYLGTLPDGTITTVNQTFLALTGFNKDALLRGKKLVDLLTAPGRIFYETHFTPLLKLQGFVKEIAFDIQKANGDLLPVLINAAEARRNDDQTALTWLTVFDARDRRQYERDLIAARKRAEQAAEMERRARENAEAANRAKDDFLALVSHELRSPLNAILGWTQLLRHSRSADEELTEGLAVIERNTRVQVQLIEDLLDMSRIASGKVRLDVQRVPLASVIADALATAHPAAAAKSIRLTKMLDSTIVVAGDPGRLQQVFWNLLSNALKFTPPHGSVRVVMQRINSHVDVSVIDSGQGMSAEFLRRAFDKFSQSDAASVRRSGGLGLGLSIARNLVEMHGGQIAAKSDGEGKGATFTVTLPLSVALDEGKVHPRAATAALPVAIDGISLAQVKVLVVDDEKDTRELLEKLLRRFNAEVRTADSAEQALEAISEFKPYLLISDIGLPRQDGYELIRRVRMLGGGIANTKALALTAFGRLEDRTQAMLAGFQMHLAKPIEPTELIVTVASMTGVIAAPTAR